MAKEFCTFAAGILSYLASSSMKFSFNGTLQSKITIRYRLDNPFALKILLGVSSVEFQYICIASFREAFKKNPYFFLNTSLTSRLVGSLVPEPLEGFHYSSPHHRQCPHCERLHGDLFPVLRPPSDSPCRSS